MALTKPILNSVPAWDVSKGQTFTFNVVGGDQVVANVLYILNNQTNVVVYTVVYTLETPSYQYKAIVPPNVPELQNGVYYSAYVVTKNSSDETSVPSNSIQFYCYTTPTWEFTNISSGTIINNSSVTPILYYNQIENEALNDYTINLYNAGRSLISSSGVRYTGSSASSQTVSFSFSGLEDGTLYYVEGVGHTVGGTIINTGLIDFTASYVPPESFNVFSLQNNCEEGYVAYYSLAYVIEGDSYPSPPVYETYNNKRGVNLRPSNRWVEWNPENSNFIIPQNFTMKAWVRIPVADRNLITLSENENITVWYGYHPFDSTKVIVTLNVNEEYFIYSNAITPPTSAQELCIQIRRVNGIFDILLEVV